MHFFANVNELRASLEPRGPLSLPAATALGNPMQTWGKTLFTEADSSIVSGLWQCEPGQSFWNFSDRGEVIHVLSGVMHVQEEGGERVTLRAGSAAAFPKGWKGNWDIEETIFKFFTIYR